MKPIIKAAKIVTGIVEGFYWVGAVLMLAATVCSLAAPELVRYFVGITAREGFGAQLSVGAFEVVAPVVNGQVEMHALFLFGIGAVLILVLMAMMFRNMHLIIKKSQLGTPFQPDNIRMLREIGIFSVAIPVVGLIMSVVIRLVLGADAVETSVDLSSVCMGIIVLCLTQYFIYGAKLEEDVEGLV